MISCARAMRSATVCQALLRVGLLGVRVTSSPPELSVISAYKKLRTRVSSPD